MFTTLKAKLIGAGVIVALILSLWAALRYYKGEAQEARQDAKEANRVSEDLTAARVADTASSEAHGAILDTIKITEEKGRAETEAALDAHRDWADQPVPDDVLDSLRR